MTHTTDGHDELIPRAPWTWESTTEGGLRLAAADGTDVLTVDGGRGMPEFHSTAAKRLLAEAGSMVELLAEARGWARGYETGWFDVDTDNPPDWLVAPLRPREALPDAEQD